MNLGSWKIDDVLTFPANTHDPTTGAATNAASITYRVYEDQNAVPILTGNMTLLDGGNVTGLYTAQVTLSAANGFEHAKCYTIVIQATVNGVLGTLSHSFQIRADVTPIPGPGAILFTYTLTDSTTGLPIHNASVWVTTDVAGMNRLCSGYTDDLGEVQFYLDAGTYQFWAWKTGYGQMGPDAEVVS